MLRSKHIPSIWDCFKKLHAESLLTISRGYIYTVELDFCFFFFMWLNFNILLVLTGTETHWSALFVHNFSWAGFLCLVSTSLPSLLNFFTWLLQIVPTGYFSTCMATSPWLTTPDDPWLRRTFLFWRHHCSHQRRVKK